MIRIDQRTSLSTQFDEKPGGILALVLQPAWVESGARMRRITYSSMGLRSMALRLIGGGAVGHVSTSNVSPAPGTLKTCPLGK